MQAEFGLEWGCTLHLVEARPGLVNQVGSLFCPTSGFPRLNDHACAAVSAPDLGIGVAHRRILPAAPVTGSRPSNIVLHPTSAAVEVPATRLFQVPAVTPRAASRRPCVCIWGCSCLSSSSSSGSSTPSWLQQRLMLLGCGTK